MKNYFFLAGLPRTGTTLLGALLNQNPNIYVGPTSPVLEFLVEFDLDFQRSDRYQSFPKEEFRTKTLSRICEDWYADIDKPYIIDKSRAWPKFLDYAKLITEDVKIICTVRDVLDILSSWILLNRKSNTLSFIDRQVKNMNLPLNDDNRCESLMLKGSGVVEQSLYCLAQPFLTQNTDILHIVEYEDLVNSPKTVIDGIYEFLNIEPFNHSFNAIENKVKEDDMVYGLPGMHDVRESISKQENNPHEILSKKIIQKYSNMEFWR